MPSVPIPLWIIFVPLFHTVSAQDANRLIALRNTCAMQVIWRLDMNGTRICACRYHINACLLVSGNFITIVAHYILAAYLVERVSICPSACMCVRVCVRILIACLVHCVCMSLCICAIILLLRVYVGGVYTCSGSHCKGRSIGALTNLVQDCVVLPLQAVSSSFAYS